MSQCTELVKEIAGCRQREANKKTTTKAATGKNGGSKQNSALDESGSEQTAPSAGRGSKGVNGDDNPDDSQEEEKRKDENDDDKKDENNEDDEEGGDDRDDGDDDEGDGNEGHEHLVNNTHLQVLMDKGGNGENDEDDAQSLTANTVQYDESHPATHSFVPLLLHQLCLVSMSCVTYNIASVTYSVTVSLCHLAMYTLAPVTTSNYCYHELYTHLRRCTITMLCILSTRYQHSSTQQHILGDLFFLFC